MEYPHQPVLLREVISYLNVVSACTYVDGTVGSGGHSEAIGRLLGENGRLICLDRDPHAVSLSKKRLSFMGDNVHVIKARYAELDEVLDRLGVGLVDGVLLDLGMSSYQLDKSGRGFSFNRDEPLDMRMDPSEEITARHLVNNLSQADLEQLIRDYGEEKRAKLIAGAIVRRRAKDPIESTFQLAALIKSIFPPSIRYKNRHPATRTFQAFRIAVNRELEEIKMFLEKIPFLIAEGGRLVVVAYHSLEDRLIKQAMVNWERECTCPPDFPVCVCGKVRLFRRLLKKGIKPDPLEVEENPRARSAVMRAVERVSS